MIGQLCVFNNSVHRHPQKLKMSDKLLLTLTKTLLKGVPVASSTSSFCMEMKALVLTIPKIYVTLKFGVGKYELWSLEEKNSEF